MGFLILFSYNLKTCDLQFGFQENSSTSMCTWLATEVISYYIRNNTSVYCCLLDLKKAFDKVQFAKLFKKLIENNFPAIEMYRIKNFELLNIRKNYYLIHEKKIDALCHGKII